MGNDVVVTNLGILLALLPVGVFMAWGCLRALDKLTGVRFRDSMAQMSKRSMALSIYYSARFLGVMYLVAALTGRFI